MYVGAVLSVIGILIGLTQQDEIREQIADADASLTESDLDAAVNVSMAFIVILGLVGVGLWIWMAVMNRKGKSWARVVATVLGGLNIGLTVIGLLGGAAAGQADSAINTLMSIITVVLAVAILALLYQRSSTEYYEARGRWEASAAPRY